MKYQQHKQVMSLPQTPSFQQIQLCLNNKLSSQTRPAHSTSGRCIENTRRCVGDQCGFPDIRNQRRKSPECPPGCRTDQTVQRS